MIDMVIFFDYYSYMDKKEAFAIFGGEKKLVSAIGCSQQNFNKFSDPSNKSQSDRIIGAATRIGRPVPAKFLDNQPVL